MKRLALIILLSYTTTFAYSQVYCIPSSVSSLTYINSFSTTAGLTNISNINSGFSTGGFGNFTNKIIMQKKGDSIKFTMNFVPGTSNGSVHCKIWVDWNRDSVFDNVAEKVYDKIGSVNPMSGNFIVPLSALTGSTRMRVMIDYWYAQTPCAFNSSGTRGEAEDYTVYILSQTPNVYRFIGNGLWSDSSNWQNQIIPPSVLPAGDQIIIDPLVSGECLLNITQTISTSGSIVVMSGKKFNVPGNVIIQ